jgi:hypothetical protein
MKGKNKPFRPPQSPQKWKTSTHRLADNHSWKAPKGYKIIVLDRGAVSFNFPDTWIVAKMEPLELHDGEPPNDNARLSVSFWRLPPGVDWTGLPLPKLLADSTKDISDVKVLERGEIEQSTRTDIELVYMQNRFLDEPENREAYTRIAMARGFNVAALITFDFWVDDVAKFAPVWDEVLRSLHLGRYVADPTKGVTLH